MRLTSLRGGGRRAHGTGVGNGVRRQGRAVVRSNATVENHERTVGYGQGKRWNYTRPVWDDCSRSKRAIIVDTLKRIVRRVMTKER